MSHYSLTEYQKGDEKGFNFELYRLNNSLYNFDEAYTIRRKNEIVGFITFNFFENGELGIGLFEVTKQRQGIGSEIINELKSCEDISSIWVNISSEKGKKFWEKNGFIQENEDWVWRRS